MRRMILLAVLAVAPLSAFAPLAAQAEMVAGWDFSQYISPGILSIDGETAAPNLGANYSNMLPEDINGPYALGPAAAPFGRLYYDGQFGSSDIASTIDFTGNEDFRPLSGSFASNLDAPILSGDSVWRFESLEVLALAGQQFTNPLAGLVEIGAPLRLVFSADLRGVPETGTDWSVSFAGQTLEGSTIVQIEFSTDGTTYTPVDSVTLTTLDTPFFVSLSDGPSEQAFVRLNFTPDPDEFPAIDNVAININVPEPGSGAQAVAVLLTLLGVTRVRQGSAA